MAGPEVPRRGTFLRTTARRETSSPVLPGHEVRRTGSPEPGKPPKTRKSLIQRLANNLALRWVLAGTALAGTYGVYQENPALHQAVDQQILERFGLIEATVPSTFDNTKNKGLFGVNNINRVDLSEVERQFPEQVIEKDNTISIILPFILPEETTASYTKSLSEMFPTKELRQQAQAENDKDTIDFVLPKGTVIVSPVNGHGAIGFGNPEAGQDSTKAHGAAIVFYDQSANRTYLIKIFSPDQSLFELIGNTPQFDARDKKYFRDTGWKDLPVIDRGTPLMQTQNSNQQVRLTIEAYKGERIGPEAAITNRDLYLLTPEFFTTKDSSGQDHILMLLQKN